VSAPEEKFDREGLLGFARWHRETRDPELRKALAFLQAVVADAAFLLERARGSAERSESARALLDLLSRAPPVETLKVEDVWDIVGELRLALIPVADDAYLRTLLEHEQKWESRRRSGFQWSDYFSLAELQELVAALGADPVSPSARVRAVERLRSLYLQRLERVREERVARKREAIRQSRILAGSAVIALAGLTYASVSLGFDLGVWKRALAGALALAALTAVVILLRFRDALRTIDDLQKFATSWKRDFLIWYASIGAVVATFAGAHASAARLLARDGASENTSLGGAAAGTLAVVVATVLGTGFWRRWRFWRRPPAEGVATAIVMATLALVVLTEAFSQATAVFAALGWVELPATATLAEVEENYVWHFMDAIPFLDVTKTLAWKRPLDDYEKASGLLLLGYELLVILPIVALIRQLLNKRPERREEDASLESPHV
jgi:hypothetical protein